MKIDFTGRGVDITDRIRTFSKSKFDRIKKHLDDVHGVSMVLSVEKYRHKAEVKFLSGKRAFHGAEETADMFQSIDRVIEKLETQVKKYKEKLTTKKRNTTESIRLDDAPQDTPPTEEDSVANGEVRIIRVQDPVRPMNLDEAVEDLDRLNQDFIIFRDSVSENINVIYRRNDGNIGLIDPRT